MRRFLPEAPVGVSADFRGNPHFPRGSPVGPGGAAARPISPYLLWDRTMQGVGVWQRVGRWVGTRGSSAPGVPRPSPPSPARLAPAGRGGEERASGPSPSSRRLRRGRRGSLGAGARMSGRPAPAGGVCEWIRLRHRPPVRHAGPGPGPRPPPHVHGVVGAAPPAPP